MNLRKRMLLGSSIVILGMVSAIIMSFVYTYLISKFPQQSIKFSIIFGVGGTFLGIATMIFAAIVYTGDSKDL